VLVVSVLLVQDQEVRMAVTPHLALYLHSVVEEEAHLIHLGIRVLLVVLAVAAVVHREVVVVLLVVLDNPDRVMLAAVED
jgi:hypothetical protein